MRLRQLGTERGGEISAATMGAAGPRVSEQPTYRRGAGSAVRGRKASFGRRDDKTDPPPRCNANTHSGARPLFEAGQKKLGSARLLETVENASKQEQTPRPSARNDVPRADRFRNGACREPGDVDAGAPPLRVGPTNRPRSRSWKSGCRWAGLGFDAGSRPTGGGTEARLEVEEARFARKPGSVARSRAVTSESVKC